MVLGILTDWHRIVGFLAVTFLLGFLIWKLIDLSKAKEKLMGVIPPPKEKN